jgi:hypothetical protein
MSARLHEGPARRAPVALNKKGRDMPLQRMVLLASTLACAMPVLAEESTATEEKSEEELAKAAQNPVADIYSFPFQDNIGLNYGPNKGVQNVLNFQPVIPIHAGPVNVITRTIIPLVTQPSLVPGGKGATTGLGDINFTAFVSPAKPGALIWGIGPVLSFPTATSPQVGSQSTWGLGPSVVLLTMPGPWVIGVVSNVVWSIAGDSGNSFLLQYFINYNFGNGWYVTTAPIITATWNPPGGTPSNAQWTVPFGAGFGKLQKFGRLPINFSAQAFWDAVHPDAAPYAPWTIRLQITVLL